MHNKVVFRAAAALNDAGIVSLRINFRGVGQSTGLHDAGQGELDDAHAGLTYLANQYPGQRLTVCGFSFGARVGMEVGISDDRVEYLISIGTPLAKYDFTFLKSCRKPLLFVQGERDEFGDMNSLAELVAQLEKQTQVQLIVIPGAGHFFDGHLHALKHTITAWITRQLSD